MSIYKKYGPVNEPELEAFLKLPRECQIRLLKQVHGPAVCFEWIYWPESEIRRMLLRLDQPGLKAS